MSSQVACLKICIISLDAFMRFFCESVFWNAVSNDFHEEMRSHIGCICAAFRPSEFSNVFSSCLREQMHNHIGCICAIFRRSEFSNVVSNSLREKM